MRTTRVEMKMLGFPTHYEQRVYSKILEYFERQKIRHIGFLKEDLIGCGH